MWNRNKKTVAPTEEKKTASDACLENAISALNTYLVEEKDVALPASSPDPLLQKFFGLVEQLRKKHVTLLQQNEQQTIGEGETELTRRRDLRTIAKTFDERVGRLTRSLSKAGQDGTQAKHSVMTSVT